MCAKRAVTRSQGAFTTRQHWLVRRESGRPRCEELRPWESQQRRLLKADSSGMSGASHREIRKSGGTRGGEVSGGVGMSSTAQRPVIIVFSDVKCRYARRGTEGYLECEPSCECRCAQYVTGGDRVGSGVAVASLRRDMGLPKARGGQDMWNASGPLGLERPSRRSRLGDFSELSLGLRRFSV